MTITDELVVNAVDSKENIDCKKQWLYNLISGFTELGNASFWSDEIDGDKGCAIIKGYMDDWDSAIFSKRKDIDKHVKEWVDDVITSMKDIAGETDDQSIRNTISIHDHEGYGGMSVIFTDGNEGHEYDKLMIIPAENR